MAFGTHDVKDTLAAFLVSQNQRVADFGEENTYDAIQQMLDAQNALMMDFIADLVTPTESRLELYGGTVSMVTTDLDEYGIADAQKITAGQTLGYPLVLSGYTLQWTKKYLEVATVAEMLAAVKAMMTADKLRLLRDMKRALFFSTNVTTTDRLVDNISIPVKRLLNADGAAIPADPYGNTFNGATHTHYLGSATFTEAALILLIETVLEHNANGAVALYINRANEAAIRGFTTSFTPRYDGRLIVADTITHVGTPLDMQRIQDRAIGTFASAEVFVKPWIPANYSLAFDVTRPPLRFRTRGVAGRGEMRLVYEDENHPLRARSWEREFGVGVRQRDAAAVLKSDNATYANPTIT